MAFPTSRTPGNKTQVHTPLGNRIAETERDIPRITSEVIEEMSRKLGRPPTKGEMYSGPKAADNRTIQEKMEREAWKPKRPATDAMDSLADSLEDQSDEPDYQGLTLRQRLAADARRIAERNRGTSESDTQKSEKLRRLKHDLQKIDNAISEENWRAERGSQRVVDLLEMTREQLTEGSDPQETRRLRGEVTRLLSERAKVEDLAKREAVRVLQAEIASIRDGSQLGSVGEADPVRYRAEQLMAEGADPTSAWSTARSEQNSNSG